MSYVVLGLVLVAAAAIIINFVLYMSLYEKRSRDPRIVRITTKKPCCGQGCKSCKEYNSIKERSQNGSR